MAAMNDVIPLPARLDAVAAPILAADLLTRDLCNDLCLDASETVHIGAMAAQVLLSLRRTADANEISLSIDNLQPRPRQQLQLMGLTELTTRKDAT
ncbi:STAS domain-containing protein [Tateyamaria omphalii]|uniref:STAS domain-containing protein n=1 Tax=Tateyamaria omphalii TaxID=299262 RepID=UPI001C999558|nr:STAS domain-containing protein [Tateyamaria omphalii]MBY5932601.1 STAS domain-containing protein [Tateyamaria omphalii]